MLKLKKCWLGAFLGAAALPAGACAADAPLPVVHPAMWVVKDADTTVYMFGTFHMLDGKRDWFNGAVKRAFDASSEVVLEAIIPENPAEMQPVILKYAVDPVGKTLSQKLNPDMKARLDKELGAIGLPAQAFDPLEPWFVSMTLTSLGAQKLGLKPEFGPEGILLKAAKAGGKSVGELEGVEKQLSIMDALPEATQIAAMGETLEEMPKLGQKFAPMLDAWSSGDTDRLVKLLDEGEETLPEFRKAMFTDRNAKWADWVSARMQKPGVVFMAVGAGHLTGEDSVQSFLARKGIKAERVKS
jgi:uncharacterized protein YbaP (TraB family)